jgi:hypothetical protein
MEGVADCACRAQRNPSDDSTWRPPASNEKKWARLVMCHGYRETVNSSLLVLVFRTTLATATNTLHGPRLFMEIYFSVGIALGVAAAERAAEQASFAASANSDESIFNVKRQAGLSGCSALKLTARASRPPRMDQKRARLRSFIYLRHTRSHKRPFHCWPERFCGCVGQIKPNSFSVNYFVQKSERAFIFLRFSCSELFPLSEVACQ